MTAPSTPGARTTGMDPSRRPVPGSLPTSGSTHGTPEVTIAITTRDRGALLLRALRSALAQTSIPIEVIIVDDGSVDAVVVDADPRVTLVRFETSRGVCAARNEALARARGPWIAFLDDDDELAPMFAERALDAAAASDLPAPVAVLGTIEVRFADGRPREL